MLDINSFLGWYCELNWLGTPSIVISRLYHHINHYLQVFKTMTVTDCYAVI